MITDQAHNTQVATIGTEHSLATIAVAGEFAIAIDMSNMAEMDGVEFRIKSKVLTAGTQITSRLYQFYGNAPVGTKLFLSDWIPNINTDSASVEFSLKQVYGTGRSFPWQIFKRDTITAGVIWDELVASHTIAGSFGQGSQVIQSGTAQPGSTASTIKLSAASSSVSSYYNGKIVVITAGTGEGQYRVISSYVGSTRVATVDANWNTTPDSTSQFLICGY